VKAIRRLLVSFGVSVVVLSSSAIAQKGSSEAQLRLDLQRAEVNERVSAAALKQKTTMRESGLLSESEITNAQADYERSKIETARARLVLANELPSFRVESAIKTAGPGGESLVRLTIQELRSADLYDEKRTYLISLLGQGTIIAIPYQQQVTVHGGARNLTLSFQLLRDTDDLTVLVVSGARREEIPIVLQRSGAGKLVMTAPNFSQTGVFGDKVDYAIELQRFSREIQTLDLAVERLPAGFTYEWVDRDSGAKLISIRFGENQNALRLTLRVFLPAREDAGGSAQPVSFRVAARGAGGAASYGTIDLQLQTTGAPELALIADNLLMELDGKRSKRLNVTVENSGPVEARDVMITSELPPGLSLDAPVPAVRTLRPNERKQVIVVLSATDEAVPGEYTVKMNARTQSRMAQIDSPDVSLRVMINASTLRSSTIGLLALSLAILVGSATWAARKLRRG
jgi:NPCBM-associated, NEW3 domain of alpha-galactosidase